MRPGKSKNLGKDKKNRHSKWNDFKIGKLKYKAQNKGILRWRKVQIKYYFMVEISKYRNKKILIYILLFFFNNVFQLNTFSICDAILARIIYLIQITDLAVDVFELAE